MKLLPLILVRLAGLDFTKHTLLDNGNIINIAKEILNLQSEQETIIKDQLISEELLILMKDLKKPEERLKIFNLRRKIHNQKKLKEEECNYLKSINGAPILKRYLKIDQKIETLIKEGESKYTEEELLESETINELATLNSFQLGITQSSHILSINLHKYLNKEDKNYNKKDKTIQITALKYLSRMVTKTSPFSTFGKITTGQLKPLEDELIQIKEPNKIVEYSELKSNIFLLKILEEILMKEDKFLETKEIYLNPSINKQNEKLKYLISNGGKDEFKLLLIKPIIELTINSIPFSEKMKINELINTIEKHKYGTKEDILKFIKNLIKIDFLVIEKMHYSNWENNLYQKIKILDISNERINSIKTFMEGLIKSSKYIKNQSINQRININTQISIEIKKILNKENENKEINNSNYQNINSGIYSLNPENVQYEDCYYENKLEIDSKTIIKLTKSINELTKHFEPLNYLEIERNRLINIFKEFNPNEVQVSLLNFYEYYLNIKDKNKHKIDENLEIINEKYEILWSKYLQKIIKNSLDEIKIERDELIKINNIIKIKRNFKNKSYSSFIQITTNESNKQAVLGKRALIHSGNGKFFSRFLPGMDLNTTQIIRKYNESLNEQNEIKVEINDDTMFNANIHPLLLPFELNFHKTLFNTSDLNQRINVNKINIEVIKNKITLIDQETGKIVKLYDLGFQSLNTRSNFFNFLFLLSESDTFSLDYIYKYITKINNKEKSKLKMNKISINKRIVYDSKIILKRKGWEIPLSLLPIWDKNSTNLRNYLNIQNFIKENNLPERAFVYFHNDIQNKKKSTDHKPLFINFNSILYINLFYKEIDSESQYLYFEEVLPNEKDLIKINNKKIATEFLITWNN